MLNQVLKVSSGTCQQFVEDAVKISNIFMACHIVYGTPYCNDAKEGVGGKTQPRGMKLSKDKVLRRERGV